MEHPTSGRRPYLVMTREAVIPVLRRVVAVPATRRIRGIPSELVSPRLGPIQMARACRALATALGC